MGATYNGWRDERGGWLVAGNGKPLPITGLAARKGGLSWGYGGSGVSALAFALLAAEFGEGVAELLYKPFRDDMVAGWKSDQPWRILSREIRRWAVGHITTGRMLARMDGKTVPLLAARVYPWADGTSIEAGWPDVVSVLNTGVLAFDGEAVRAWRREGDLASLEATGGVIWCEAEPIERLRELVPPLVAGCELRLLRYPALGHATAIPVSYEGRCLIRWRRWHGPQGLQASVVVSELEGELTEQVGLHNESTVITNRVPWLATVLRAELDVPPERFIYIEHLPARGGRRPGGWESPADFSLVTCDWTEASMSPDHAPPWITLQARSERWKYLSRDTAEQLTGISLDDTALRAAWNAWPATIEGARR